MVNLKNVWEWYQDSLNIAALRWWSTCYWFLGKWKLFNNFFSQQCTIVAKNSSISVNTTFETENRLSTFECSIGNVIKVINALDPSKAYGHDAIWFIRMIKLCASSISKPLHFIPQNCLENGCSPKVWKKVNVVPVYKKGNKQFINCYRPALLLPICAKFFEKTIFNCRFNSLDTSRVLNNNAARVTFTCIS